MPGTFSGCLMLIAVPGFVFNLSKDSVLNPGITWKISVWLIYDSSRHSIASSDFTSKIGASQTKRPLDTLDHLVSVLAGIRLQGSIAHERICAKQGN